MPDLMEDDVPVEPATAEKVTPQSSLPHEEAETREDDALGLGVVRPGDTY